MHKSAYKLAVKYNNKEFAIKILKKLQSLINSDEVCLLKNDADKIKVENSVKYKSIIDFENNFYLSEARW
jgi:hypothetical protein